MCLSFDTAPSFWLGMEVLVYLQFIDSCSLQTVVLCRLCYQ